MGNKNIPGGNEPEYPREIYEPVLAPSIDLDAYLKQELTISYFDMDGDHEMQTCYGDIKLTIDALMDYTQMLDTVCEQWKLTGFHRASYEYHADRLRKFAGKLQTAIGYDYVAALEKCRKKQKRKPKDDDIGEDGITLAAKRRKAPAQEDSGDREPSDGSPSEAYPLSEEEDAFPPAGDISSPEETDYKVTIEKIEGGIPRKGRI